jgi:hypothetical protein
MCISPINKSWQKYISNQLELAKWIDPLKLDQKPHLRLETYKHKCVQCHAMLEISSKQINARNVSKEHNVYRES